MPETIKDTYLTIAQPSEGIYKEKGSKFLAFAFPVSTHPQAKEIIDSLKKKYFDARHHCYAYRLGADMKLFRTNDDGEPSNSAGKPILGQIIAHQLTDILIVVVRYFGGTLLGVGGLIQAYKSASNDAISHATIITREVCDQFQFTFDYPLQTQAMKIMKELEGQIIEIENNVNCTMIVQLRKSYSDLFLEKLNNLGIKAELYTNDNEPNN